MTVNTTENRMVNGRVRRMGRQTIAGLLNRAARILAAVAGAVILSTASAQTDPPVIVNKFLEPAYYDVPYSASFQVGGTSAFTLLSVLGLPPGLNATLESGGSITLSGRTTAAPGTYTLTVITGSTAGTTRLAVDLPLLQLNDLTAGSISLGTSHGCAVSNGGVQCWGLNSSGQLGNKTNVDSTYPVQAIAEGSNATMVSAGAAHTCAVVNEGVYCWGANSYGQLGTGTTKNSAKPVRAIAEGSGVTGVSAGENHSCAVVKGGLQCWGNNDVAINILGIFGYPSLSNPTQVIAQGLGVTAVAAGSYYTCIVLNGGVQCWGRNYALPEAGDTAIPGLALRILGSSANAASLSAGGQHACAIMSGGVQCWGANASGQLGNGGTAFSASPVPVIGIAAGATSVSAGSNHTCAAVDGGLKCWGGNGAGQLGNNTTANSSLPVNAIVAGSGASAAAAGGNTSCAIVNGMVRCWGANDRGQLANGAFGGKLSPLQILPASSGTTALAAGSGHTCIVLNGGVQCWGNNDSGQLGVTGPSRSSPAQVLPAGSNATAVAAGTNHSCAIVSGGVQCWGNGSLGQLGNGDTSNNATPQLAIGANLGATAVAAGVAHTCAVVGGGVQCWGDNSNGQLGIGSSVAKSLVPVTAIPAGSGVTGISAGTGYSCAVVNGGVKCWGLNNTGQLGNDTLTSSQVPVTAIPAGSNATMVSAGYRNTCAVVSRGLKCWGANSKGEIGLGSTYPWAGPSWVVNPGYGVTAVSTSVDFTCMVLSGDVECWGYGGDGRLGYNRTADSLMPVHAISEGAGTTVIAAGGSHACALVSGAVHCWGNNASGAVGYTLNPQWLPAAARARVAADAKAAPISVRGGIDVDGNGREQILLRKLDGTRQLQMARLENNLFKYSNLTDPGSSYRVVGVGDFNGDGISDLAFQNMTQGTLGDVKIWKSFSADNEITLRQVKQVWDVQAVGDLDGDGFGDLVWRYVAADPNDTGVSYIWFTSGSTVTQVRKRGGAPLDWQLLGAADLNGDGAADMLYLSPQKQLRALMATPNRTCANVSAGSISPGYSVLRFADFTGNRRGDLLSSDVYGNVLLSSLNASGLSLPPYTGVPDDPNASCTASSLSVTTTTYIMPSFIGPFEFYATGDLDGDGVTDVVWKQGNGLLTVWLMNRNGTAPTVISNAGTAPSNSYSVIQSGPPAPAKTP